MKKLLVALLSVVTCASLFAFAACGDGTEANNGNTNENGGNVGDGGNVTPEKVAMTESEWTEYWNDLSAAESWTSRAVADRVDGLEVAILDYDSVNKVVAVADGDVYHSYYLFNTESSTVVHYERGWDIFEEVYVDWTKAVYKYESAEDVNDFMTGLNFVYEYAQNIIEDDWYSTLTYDSAKDSYSGTVTDGAENINVEVKIEESSVTVTEYYEEEVYSYCFSGINSTVVTVPQDVLAAPESGDVTNVGVTGSEWYDIMLGVGITSWSANAEMSISGETYLSTFVEYDGETGLFATTVYTEGYTDGAVNNKYYYKVSDDGTYTINYAEYVDSWVNWTEEIDESARGYYANLYNPLCQIIGYSFEGIGEYAGAYGSLAVLHSLFTYDADTSSYTATLYLPDADENVDFCFIIEHGVLKKYSYSMGGMECVYEISGINSTVVTVPQDVLNVFS